METKKPPTIEQGRNLMNFNEQEMDWLDNPPIEQETNPVHTNKVSAVIALFGVVMMVGVVILFVASGKALFTEVVRPSLIVSIVVGGLMTFISGLVFYKKGWAK